MSDGAKPTRPGDAHRGLADIEWQHARKLQSMALCCEAEVRELRDGSPLRAPLQTLADFYFEAADCTERMSLARACFADAIDECDGKR